MSNHGEIQEPKSIKTSVEQQFSQVAANYSTSAVHASGAELLHMIEVADLKGNERVLDAGCGAQLLAHGQRAQIDCDSVRGHGEHLASRQGTRVARGATLRARARA